MTAEISFDVVMKEEMGFVEGAFRLPQGDWQVLIFKRKPIPQPVIKYPATWASGATGVIAGNMFCDIALSSGERIHSRWAAEFWNGVVIR